MKLNYQQNKTKLRYSLSLNILYSLSLNIQCGIEVLWGMVLQYRLYFYHIHMYMYVYMYNT